MYFLPNDDTPYGSRALAYVAAGRMPSGMPIVPAERRAEGDFAEAVPEATPEPELGLEEDGGDEPNGVTVVADSFGDSDPFKSAGDGAGSIGLDSAPLGD